MGLLRQAFLAGYTDTNAFRTGRDLDRLRGRDDFRVLMMDMATPDSPFAR